ncbi:Na(+)/H(+) antiporter subunit C [Pseudactinotalea sp. Z1732]|uniref:Na(+)/H(+) antiporter subunit C n=1 Tax=Micrococcales TaxID=85006 RepID=UPI003C7C209D
MIEASPSLALVIAVGVQFGAGVYLLLERSLTRVLVGIYLIGNGVNLMFLLAGGAAASPPLLGSGPQEEMADPLPQAMVLTAIVINLGLTAFVLAMAYRTWQLHGHDEVQDDLEDRRLAQRLERGELDTRDDDLGVSLAVEAAEARDETEEPGIEEQPSPSTPNVSADDSSAEGPGGAVPGAPDSKGGAT